MAEWSIPLDVLAKKINMSLEMAARQAAIEVFTRVVMRSPVDTGRFRANWNVTYNNPGTKTTANTDRSGEGKLAEIKSALLRFPVGNTFWLCNSLPYAMVLEYGQYPNPPKGGEGKSAGGFSTQAPSGMVRLTAVEFKDAVNAAIKRLS